MTTTRSSPSTNPDRSTVASDAPLGNLQRATRELKAASVVTIGFGLLFALGSHDATDAPVRLLADLVFLRLGDGVAELTEVNHLADAILGGVMAGWGVMIWLLADRLLRIAPAEIKRILAISLSVWFPIDTAGSIASGAWFNGVLNVAFLVMFLVPLRRL